MRSLVLGVFFSLLGCQGSGTSHPIARATDRSLCLRGAGGVDCAMWQGLGFSPSQRWSDAFGDRDGYGASPVYWGTLRRPDLDGDYADDLCVRGPRGLACALRRGGGFQPVVESGPEFSDAAGFADPRFALTLQFPDLDGDGRADACARGPNGLVCARGRGDGSFEPASLLAGSALHAPDERDVLLFGDLDDDGHDDLCLRRSGYVACALAIHGQLVAPEAWIDGFTGAEGFDAPVNRATLALVDVNGDRRADLCGRGSTGLVCALSSGTGFATPAVWSAAFSDDAVGDRADVVASLRFADVDGDGRADACARRGEDVICALSMGDRFADPTPWITGAFGDGAGFGGASSWASFVYVDLDRDGRADVCARAPSGVTCAYSTGASFDAALPSSAFSDAAGFAGRPDVQLLGADSHARAAHPLNRVSLENERPGTPGWWVPYPQWSLRHEIEGYADALSYAAGATVIVRASTAHDGDRVRWTLFRTGWYGGVGARALVSGETEGRAQMLPARADSGSAARVSWSETFRVALPADAVSGVYALRLDNLAHQQSSFITFVVREDDRSADLAVGRADYTDLTYNNWDGADNRSSAYLDAGWVSLDRPLRSAFALGGIHAYSAGYFTYEYSMVRFLERQGYDVTYLSSWDLDHDANALDRARAYLSVGHDEYWTPAMRDHVEAARDAGKHLGFFGSDVLDGILRVDASGRTFTPYDEHRHRMAWDELPVIAGAPAHAQAGDELTGTHYAGWCGQAKKTCGGGGDGQPFGELASPDDFVFVAPRHPLLRGVLLGPMQTMARVVGYEYQVPYSDTAPLPFHVDVLADAPAISLPRGTPVMVAYQTAGGARVFNAGSMHWTHALDSWAGRSAFRVQGDERECGAHDFDCFNHENPAAQRFTANVLADFGAQPATPAARLSVAGACDWLRGCE
jgi:hypothetical protein